jgi:glutamine cyclotransferase
MSDKAVKFMRDQTFSNDLVISGGVTKGGRVTYLLQSGASYTLDDADIKTLDRYRFKPRYAPASREGEKG